MWGLGRGIEFIVNQHNGGIKLEDLLEEMAVLKEDGLIEDCCVANVLDYVENSDTMEYLIYGNNRYFIYGG